jgi:hypothetical protein
LRQLGFDFGESRIAVDKSKAVLIGMNDDLHEVRVVEGGGASSGRQIAKVSLDERFMGIAIAQGLDVG